jgi:pyruvate/2-oxoglutarate dehydrogenase complex dihydrolipoamide dehydrogenase (E3) component
MATAYLNILLFRLTRATRAESRAGQTTRDRKSVPRSGGMYHRLWTGPRPRGRTGGRRGPSSPSIHRPLGALSTKRTRVIGAGPIGCELAQAFARLGSRVHVLGNHPQVLPREDPDAAARVEKAMRRDGVELTLNSRIDRVEKRGPDKVVHFNSGQGAQQVVVAGILIGAVRVPNVDGLNLDAVGVRHDQRDGVAVNDRLQTSNPNIYAAGDVCSALKFTHAADAIARIVLQNALFKGRARAAP